MKRILIFLLLLAVAGGLFAQQLTWTGRVDAGLGMTKIDGEDMGFGLWSNTLGDEAIRAQLQAVYKNEEGTAGGTLRVRAYGDASNWSSSAFQIPAAWGWMTFADGFLKVLGGRISDSEFSSVDSWWGGTLYGTAWGLQSYFYPADVFQFGIGAKTGKSPNGLSAGLTMDDMVGWVGVKTELDLFSASAQVSAQKDNIGAFISAGFYGIDSLDLDAYARFYNVSNFSDEGELEASLYLGYSGIDKLYCYVNFNPSIPMASDEDAILPFAAGVEYEVSDLLTASLDVDYVFQGSDYNGYFAWDGTYNKDHSYVGFKPTLKFSASPRANVSLGYYLAKDLSKIEPETIGKKGGMNHAAFIDFSWSF